jgi:hypothetical protein
VASAARTGPNPSWLVTFEAIVLVLMPRGSGAQIDVVLSIQGFDVLPCISFEIRMKVADVSEKEKERLIAIAGVVESKGFVDGG